MFYGIDNDTAVFPVGAKSKDFYAGRIGSGTNMNLSYFNSVGASLAKKVYAYWGVKGPQSDLNFIIPYSMAKAQAWGAKQAQVAIVAHNINNTINTTTIFADIELGFGGWYTTGTDMNWGVLIGFKDAIHSAGLKCGVYTSLGSWQTIMGTSNGFNYVDILWGANYPSGSSFNNPPSSMEGCYSINGFMPTIWQYYGENGSHDSTKTGDANIATSLPV